MALKDIVIQRKQPEESALDKVAKGLNIAQSVIGSVGGVQSILGKMDEAKRLELAKAEEQRKYKTGEMSQPDYMKVADNFDIVKEGTQGGLKVPLATGETIFVKPKDKNLQLITPALQYQMNKDIEERKTKEAEKKTSLEIPGYGMAANEDDAKKLKDALIQKKNLDDTLDRIIQLRQEKGAELWDREAVSEAKQLATDAKLTAKNIAKLGVMSSSDEKMLNQIVPEDPTEWKVASLVGQDPILSSLQKYKEQSSKKFDNEINARLRGGVSKTSTPQSAGPTPEEIQAELRRRNIIK